VLSMIIDLEQATAAPQAGQPSTPPAAEQGIGQGAASSAQQGVTATTVSANPGVATTIPLTAEAMRRLRDIRSELSDQLISARNRREDLAEQIADPLVVNREGLEAQVRLLDARILGIESEIARTGELVAQSPVAGTQEVSFPPFENMRPDFTAITI